MSSQAGPSNFVAPRKSKDEDEYTDIPSTGVEFFEYRRKLFLASLKPPSPPANKPFPTTYRVRTKIPDPIQYQQSPPPPTSSLGKLEALLAEPGSEEGERAWNAGVGGVAKNLEGGKSLAKRLRLGLVIKILRAGWLRDGTWPIDPKTRKAAVPPPDSPPSTPASLVSVASQPTISPISQREAKYGNPFRSPPS